MSRASHEHEQEHRHEARAGSGGRVLWGRVVILGLALVLMFFLGRWTAGAGSDDEQEIERLETRVDELTDENRDLRAQLEAMDAGGTETDEDDDAGGDAEDDGDSSEGEGDDEGAGADGGDSGEEDAEGASDTAEEAGDGSEQPRTHEVQKGESLYRLAERYYGDGDKFRVIARANGLRTDDPIQPGQMLEIPPDPDA